MTDVINPLLTWLNNHPNWAGLVTFLISAGESVAILGTLVPGTIMMTAIGALAGAGVIPLWLTLICAIFGAIVGDGISYLLGHYYKTTIPLMWPFKNNPQWLEKGEKFFRKHGGKSIFIGRFVGPVRAIIPLIAGMLNFKPLRFYIANITSAIAWAPIYMLPGILMGAASLELPPDIAVHVMLMLVLVTLFIFFCIWVVIKIFSLIGYKIDQLLNQFWHGLHNSRYTRFIAITLKHHDKNQPHGQIVLAFYFIIATASFLFLAHMIAQYAAASFDINNILLHFFRNLRSPMGDNIMIAITIMGESKVILPVVIITFAWLFFNKRYYLAVHVALLAILTVASVELTKHLVQSVRPWGIVLSPNGFSFPSGHTTFATTFFIGFALLLSVNYPSKRRLLCYIAAALALVISISRLYLCAHWFTDVLGGWLLSAALLLFVTISYNRKNDLHPPLYQIIPISILSLLLIYSIAFWHYFNHYKQNYAELDYPTHTLVQEKWLQQNDSNIPLYRIGRFGLAEQFFNIQWIGPLDKIKEQLISNGWEVPPERNWISVLQRITDVESTEHLPLVSPRYLDKKPVLVLIKHTTNKKRVMVFRLWDSNIIIEPNNMRLWAGTISTIPRTYNWLFRKKSIDIQINPSLLFEKSHKLFEVKEIAISVKSSPHTFPVQRSVLLIKPKK